MWPEEHRFDYLMLKTEAVGRMYVHRLKKNKTNIVHEPMGPAWLFLNKCDVLWLTFWCDSEYSM